MVWGKKNGKKGNSTLNKMRTHDLYNSSANKTKRMITSTQETQQKKSITWSSVPSGVQESVSSFLQGKKTYTHTHGHPETYKHTHTNRKLIKQAKIHRQRVQNRQAESWSWTVRQAAAQAGELQWCKWPRRFIPRLPLPPSVRPFLLLSSSFMSSFSHNPFAGALCQHLSSALASD